ncbi:hypothetical protein B0T21DRAFT_433790 [Apiosordaria backusii]|uniref:Cycloeucalenol cycloisomerase n=1 Tax=Apiosordaria backusii TaxID=314023 RepID=A0AA40EML7_9PEZI|nr:hypothetical protein B0T21DRAFT_433790 [Apiosordaria backusii]
MDANFSEVAGARVVGRRVGRRICPLVRGEDVCAVRGNPAGSAQRGREEDPVVGGGARALAGCGLFGGDWRRGACEIPFPSHHTTTTTTTNTTITTLPTNTAMNPAPSSPPNPAATTTTTAAAEKSHFHLLLLKVHTPLWLSAVAFVVLTSSLKTWTTNAHYLTFSLLVALPPFLLPFLFPFSPAPSPNNPPGRVWYHSYPLKFNLYIFTLVTFGTYFGTAYFFQLMSMTYTFPSHLPTLDSDILRRDPQTHTVPAFLYPLTHAYFTTYYSLLLVLYDTISPKTFLRKTATVLGLGYALAWAETWFMASEMMTEWFSYGDRDRMLRVGSWGYASYFFVGVPMLRRLDGKWGWERVVIEAGGCCMGILVLLEIWGKVVGPI